MPTKRQTPEALLRKLFPPMLATLTDTPPAGDSWAYELKYDGFRAVCAIVDGSVAMWSRNELDLAPRFPAVAAALSKLKVPEVVIDGEIVVLDEQGAPRFQLLQQGDRREILIVFDILWLDGEDLRKRSYDERRVILEKTLKQTPAAIKVAEKITTSGAEALERAKKSGWEGITAKQRVWWKDELSKDVVPQTMVKDAPRVKVATWVKPRFVVQVAFTEWTADNRLRHPAFLGMREDKEVAEVVKETVSTRSRGGAEKTPTSASPRLRVKKSENTVTLSNPDRVLYPRDGITKQDVADYYAAVAEPMIRALRDRPLALEH